MLKVGITGGIGSGKTTVSRIFEQLGIPVFLADAEATKIFFQDEVQHQLEMTFGKSLLDPSGRFDRKALSRHVFSNKMELDKLNSIIHPAVAKEFESWALRNNKCAYVLKEAAILFESGSNIGMDKIITVIAPLELRIDRTMKREGMSRSEVLLRINSQLSDEEKIKRSDFVITNDELNLVIPQVLDIHAKLLSIQQ